MGLRNVPGIMFPCRENSENRHSSKRRPVHGILYGSTGVPAGLRRLKIDGTSRGVRTDRTSQQVQVCGRMVM